MLLQLSVNDRPSRRASLNRKGWLSAHLNVAVGIDDKDAATISLNSIDVTDEPNAVHSTWEAGKLSVGDKVEIRLLEDGEADPATNIRRTSESPRNLFSHIELARRLLTAINAFDAQLMEIADQARGVESNEEFDKIARAFGAIAVDLDQHLISPTLRRYPELLEEPAFAKLWK